MLLTLICFLTSTLTPLMKLGLWNSMSIRHCYRLFNHVYLTDNTIIKSCEIKQVVRDGFLFFLWLYFKTRAAMFLNFLHRLILFKNSCHFLLFSCCKFFFHASSLFRSSRWVGAKALYNIIENNACASGCANNLQQLNWTGQMEKVLTAWILFWLLRAINVHFLQKININRH